MGQMDRSFVPKKARRGRKHDMETTIALTGNPNSGKTTLFNQLSLIHI